MQKEKAVPDVFEAITQRPFDIYRRLEPAPPADEVELPSETVEEVPEPAWFAWRDEELN